MRWIEEHPDDARRLGKQLAQNAQAHLAELKAQLIRLEKKLAARCGGPVDLGKRLRVQKGSFAFDGRVLLPVGQLPLVGGLVSIRSTEGVDLAVARTDACGRFAVDGLPATVDLDFSVRAWGGHARVTLGDGAGVHILRVDPARFPAIVFSGQYDAVELILWSLGLRPKRLSAACLPTADLAAARLVFINCRIPDQLDPPTRVKLRAFVAGGGTVYFSDLTLPEVEQVWPKRVAVSPDLGSVGERKARAVDGDLRELLGAPEVTVKFNLSNWRRVAKKPESARVLLEDDVSPLSFVLSEGNGQIGFTSFHYSAQLPDAAVLALVYFLTRL